MSEKRIPCEECPWVIRNNHNDKMIKNIERFVTNGSLKTKHHRCHMVNTNIWGAVDEKNICIGSLN